jgi:hypothetical protein
MICKGCQTKVPDRNDYCVTCGRVLRPKWVRWLILALIIGALLAISPVIFRLVTMTGSISDRFQVHTLYVHGYGWIILAYVQAAVAIGLAIQPYRLLMTLVVAGLGLAALFFLNYGELTAGMVAILVLVVVVLVGRRPQRR